MNNGSFDHAAWEAYRQFQQNYKKFLRNTETDIPFADPAPQDDQLLPPPYTQEAIEIARKLYFKGYKLHFRKQYVGRAAPGHHDDRVYSVETIVGDSGCAGEAEVVLSHWECQITGNIGYVVGSGTGMSTTSSFMEAYQNIGLRQLGAIEANQPKSSVPYTSKKQWLEAIGLDTSFLSHP